LDGGDVIVGVRGLGMEVGGIGAGGSGGDGGLAGGLYRGG